MLEAAPTVGGKLALRRGRRRHRRRRRRGDAQPAARGGRRWPAPSGLGDRIVHPATTTRQPLVARPAAADAPHADGRARRHPRAGRERRHLRLGAGPGRAGARAARPPASTARTSASAGWSRSGFGREVVDRLVEPLLGGVYAGHAREISARAAVPQVVALLDRDRSMMRAAAAAPWSRPPTCRSSRASPAASAGCPGAVVGLRRASTCAPARPSATWPRAADGGWNLVVGSTRDAEVLHADAVVLATPGPRRPDGCSPTWCPTPRSSWPGSSTPRWRSSRWPSAPATSPTTAGLGVPGAAGRRRVGQGVDVLLRQVGLGARRRRGRRRAGAALLDRPAPRGAAAAAHRRRARRSWRWRTSRTPIGLSRPAGRRARPAVGRRAAAVRRRPPRPGPPHPLRGGAGAPGWRSAARRTTDWGSRPASRRRRSRRPRSVAALAARGRMSAMTEPKRPAPGQGRQGPQRHHPLHDVVGVQAARRRSGRATGPARPPRSRSFRRARRRRRHRPRRSTTSPACAPTPT